MFYKGYKITAQRLYNDFGFWRAFVWFGKNIVTTVGTGYTKDAPTRKDVYRIAREEIDKLVTINGDQP